MRVSYPAHVNEPKPQQAPVVCPYCGHSQPKTGECRECRGLFEPLSRQATQNAMGPWRVRDESNPFRPPCSYATLLTLIKKGRISRDSVIAGPTTRQFWAKAEDAPGVAHRLGICHDCHAPADPADSICTSCGASFLVSEDRNSLGLAPIRPIVASASATPASPTTDPFLSLAPEPGPVQPHQSRLPLVILVVALLVALGALAVAVLRGTVGLPAGGGAPPVGDSAPAETIGE